MQNDIDLFDTRIIYDLLRIGFDVLLGFVLAFLLFHPHTYTLQIITLVGALGGILPDPLQFVYFKFRHEPLISLQKFHLWIHSKNEIVSLWGGVFLQGMLVLSLVSFAAYETTVGIVSPLVAFLVAVYTAVAISTPRKY
jgi:hypothetical protein